MLRTCPAQARFSQESAPRIKGCGRLACTASRCVSTAFTSALHRTGALSSRPAASAAPSLLGRAAAPPQQQQPETGGAPPPRLPPLPGAAGIGAAGAGGSAVSARMHQRLQAGAAAAQPRPPGGRLPAGQPVDGAGGVDGEKPKGPPPRVAASSSTFSNILSEMQVQQREQ